MPRITEHRHLGVCRCCRALEVAPATYYRTRRPSSPRALQSAERAAVRDLMYAPRCVDLAPAAVHATLLDEGTCSLRGTHDVPRAGVRAWRA